jgi:hypothetical protein
MQSFYLRAGQYVRIIDTKILSDEYQLRVLTGDHAHEACWTEDAYKAPFSDDTIVARARATTCKADSCLDRRVH